jgi:mannose-6-phosphate isomerase-like protein (cupin superfamily)
MKRLALFLLPSALFLLPQNPADEPQPRHANAYSFADTARKEHPAVFSHPFAKGPFGSAAIVTPKDPVPLHYHAKHDETVVVLRGGGTVTLNGQKKKVRAGDVIFVPKGTVHGYLPEVGDEVLVSCFAPAFDGKDRILVDK